MTVKYIIVGQGIAGSLIAMECLERKIPFVLIDDLSKSRASRISAGTINPITGRKYLKSWMFDELLPALKERYKSFELLLGGEYLQERNIVRTIPDVAHRNTWDARNLKNNFTKHVNPESKLEDFQAVINDREGFGNVKGYQLTVKKLLNDFRAYLIKEDLLLDRVFDHSNIKQLNGKIGCLEINAEGIIFCEGYHVINNPFFSHLPFNPAKGELLLVRIPELKTDQIYKDQIFINPYEDDLYWVGASYAWEDLNDKPSEEKKAWLIAALEKAIKSSYEIVDHLAGVRPSTRKRKPLIGTHSEHENLHLFNGLGTKGASLGPYWATHLMNHLELGSELSEEVDFRRNLV